MTSYMTCNNLRHARRRLDIRVCQTSPTARQFLGRCLHVTGIPLDIVGTDGLRLARSKLLGSVQYCIFENAAQLYHAVKIPNTLEFSFALSQFPGDDHVVVHVDASLFKLASEH